MNDWRLIFCEKIAFGYTYYVLFFLLIMTQKEIILSVLEKLKPYRDMASIFITWIESGMYDDKFLGELSKSLEKSIKKVTWWIASKKLQKAWEIVRKIQLSENREADRIDAELLLSDI